MVDVKDQQQRGSVSNENNILLDPDVVTDPMSQVHFIFIQVIEIKANICFRLCFGLVNVIITLEFLTEININ